jgi:hypothetical protein
MMGRQTGDQTSLFYEFRLDDRIPKGHLLRRINVFLAAILDSMHEQLAPYYSEIGRPSIDPELMVRMPIVGYCYGLRSGGSLPRKLNCIWLTVGSASSTLMTRIARTKPSGDWRRHAGSHGSVKSFWTRRGTNVLLGRPCRQGERPQSARCLIPMGVLRDPSCGRSHESKKRARFEHGRWRQRMRDIGSWRSQKISLRP